MYSAEQQTVLITGATGFIGRHLADRFLEEGYAVKLLIRSPDKLAGHLCKQSKIILGDLDNREALDRAVADCDYILNCAANVNTWDSWNNYYSTNVLGVKNLLDAITRTNTNLKRLVHLSTVDVYDYPGHICQETYVAFGHRFGYGRSKALGERLVRKYGLVRDIPYTIFRPCNVIGEGSQFIERIGREIKSGIMLEIDQGRVNAGILDIKTLCVYVLRSINSKKAEGRIFNIRDPYDISWGEFNKSLRSIVKGKGIIVRLTYSQAKKIAQVCERVYRALRIKKEPILHRLIIDILGRSCGHDCFQLRESLGDITVDDFSVLLANAVK